MPIALQNPTTGQPLVRQSDAWVDGAGDSFPVVGGVGRFVSDDNYAASFGFQWNKFDRTQLDDPTQHPQSRARLFAATGWDQLDLRGENILEVGSGAGRFTQVMLAHTEANLYSVDYSAAVEANFRNHGHHPRLQLFQASIYALPFAPASFDRVFCFGVLQHTPDFRRSVQCLARMVRPGGELVVDFYPVRGFWTWLQAKYLFRPMTKRLPPAQLLARIERHVDALMATSDFLSRVGAGRLLNRFLPLCDMAGTFPPGLSPAQRREWAILDTFDMFSPAHDHPQRLQTVRRWFAENGLERVTADFVRYDGNNAVAVVKGYAPTTPP